MSRKRHKTHKGEKVGNFTRNAMKVHKTNNWANPMRGGFRL